MMLYENWPMALADRLGVRRYRHVIYRIRKNTVPAELVARNNGSDVRTIGEIWIGSFYDRLVDHRSLRGRPALVVDIGANCGYFAVYMASRYPEAELVCFEPETENHALAQVNLNLNGVKADLRPEAVVVGRRGSVTLNLSHDPRLHTTVAAEEAATHGIDDGRYSGRSTEVPAVDVNDAISSIAARRPIDLLKIDVEGIDLNLVTALSPANLSKIECIVVETEGTETGTAVRHLERNGFSVVEDAELLFAHRACSSTDR
jgi:FkbM family methyltransferase